MGRKKPESEKKVAAILAWARAYVPGFARDESGTLVGALEIQLKDLVEIAKREAA